MYLLYSVIIDNKFLILHLALSPVELAEKLELNEVLKRRKWFLQPCSAKGGEGLTEGFTWLISNL